MSDDPVQARTGAEEGRVMPFHAVFLSLAMPPLAALFALGLLGAEIGGGLAASILLPAYGFGAAPAFLAGRLDADLARKGRRIPLRLAIAAGLGCLAGLVIVTPLYLAGLVGGALPLVLPLACSAAALAALGLAVLLASFLKQPAGKAGT